MSNALFVSIPYAVITAVIICLISVFGMFNRRNVIKHLSNYHIFGYALWLQIFGFFGGFSILAGVLFVASKNERFELLDHVLTFGFLMMLTLITVGMFNQRIIVTDSVVWYQGMLGTVKRFELSEFANFTETVSTVGGPVTMIHAKGVKIRIWHQWQNSKTALELVRKNIHLIASTNKLEPKS